MIGQLLLQCVMAFLGTMAFALLFHVPKQYFMACGFVGACGWLVYQWMLLWCTAPIAAFLANSVVVLLSRFLAVRKRCPVTLFLISGIFPLVPGAGIYWTAFYIVTNDLAKAGEYGFHTLKIAGAIALSILLVLELPQKLFQLGCRNKKAQA